MVNENMKKKALISLGLLGLAIALLAGLSEHVSWLQVVCTSLSGTCKETIHFTLFRLPVWAWGVGFYLVLILSALWARGWLIWIVGGAIGAEATLVWVMISTKAVCIYCLGNLLVIVLITVFCFELNRFWQMLSIILLVLLVTFIPISREKTVLAKGANPEHAGVAAKVGSDIISEEELQGTIAQRLYDLDEQRYKLMRQRLDQMVAETVIKKEAAVKGVTPQDLIKDDVLSKTPAVTDEEVNQYIQTNRNRMEEWKGNEADLRSRIKSFLEQQRDYGKVVEYAKSLESKYPVTIYLEEPAPPFSRIKTEGSPALGPADAPVKVIEFSDYECPACRGAHEVVSKIRESYKGRVRWIFKDFPLKIHKDSEAAAEAAQCAADQNKFWEYQDLLYASQEPLTAVRLEGYAEQLGLISSQFKQCFESGKYKAKVQKEVADAQRMGIDRTPSFIINGKLMIGGMPLERFKEAIEAELKKSQNKS